MNIFSGKDISKIQNVHMFVAAFLSPDATKDVLVEPTHQLIAARGQLVVPSTAVNALLADAQQGKPAQMGLLLTIPEDSKLLDDEKGSVTNQLLSRCVDCFPTTKKKVFNDAPIEDGDESEEEDDEKDREKTRENDQDEEDTNKTKQADHTSSSISPKSPSSPSSTSLAQQAQQPPEPLSLNVSLLTSIEDVEKHLQLPKAINTLLHQRVKSKAHFILCSPSASTPHLDKSTPQREIIFSFAFSYIHKLSNPKHLIVPAFCRFPDLDSDKPAVVVAAEEKSVPDGFFDHRIFSLFTTQDTGGRNSHETLKNMSMRFASGALVDIVPPVAHFSQLESALLKLGSNYWRPELFSLNQIDEHLREKRLLGFHPWHDLELPLMKLNQSKGVNISSNFDDDQDTAPRRRLSVRISDKPTIIDK